MKFLAIEIDVQGVREEDFKPFLKVESLKVLELYESGIFRELYFRADKPNAVLILECETVDDARESLDSLPLVKNKLISFELIPLKPYPGFSRLLT